MNLKSTVLISPKTRAWVEKQSLGGMKGVVEAADWEHAWKKAARKQEELQKTNLSLRQSLNISHQFVWVLFASFHRQLASGLVERCSCDSHTVGLQHAHIHLLGHVEPVQNGWKTWKCCSYIEFSTKKNPIKFLLLSELFLPHLE